MATSLNELRWDGEPGHYEVYYLTLTDPGSGVGVWIRYTMVAPVAAANESATAALWCLAMDPNTDSPRTLGRKQTFPIDQLHAGSAPFSLQIGDARLGDSGMSGSCEDCSWDLRWQPASSGYEHVHPILQRLGVAKTILTLPHADLRIDGTVTLGPRRLELSGARGGQAHLWGSKHASRWAWVHCSDFREAGGGAADGAFIDGVSVFVPRFGREVGPSTPVVGRIDGEDFTSRSPLRVLANDSRFALTSWRFEAIDGRRKLIGEVDADRSLLAGVTYHDPDGDLAYCYNSETASMRLKLYERSRKVSGWAHVRTLISDGRAHFEYAQRTPVRGLELHVP